MMMSSVTTVHVSPAVGQTGCPESGSQLWPPAVPQTGGNQSTVMCAGRLSPAAAQTGRSGPSCRGCRSGSGLSAASGPGRCRKASVSAPTSLPPSAGEGARARGTGNGEGGATHTGASAREGATTWRWGSVGASAGPGCTPAAAERTDGPQGAAEGAGWPGASWERGGGQ